MQRNNLRFFIMMILTAPLVAAAAENPAPPPQIKYPVSSQHCDGGCGGATEALPQQIKYPVSSRQAKFPSPPVTGDSRTAKTFIPSLMPLEGYPEPGTVTRAANSTSSDLSETQQDSSFNVQTVPPEAPTPVFVSNSDVNRVSCNEQIVDAISSEEKGLLIKVVGKDAFLKFQILKTAEGKIKYSSMATEVFIVCGDSTYNLVAYPKSGPSRTIRLGSGTKNRIRANQSIYSSLPFEKKIMHAIKDVYTDQMPDSYQVSKVNRSVGNYKEFSVSHNRSIQIEGEGLTIYEFVLQLKPGLAEFKLNDKIFVNRKYSTNIVAICPERQILYPGESTRLFIVEQRSEKASAGVMSIKALEDNEIPVKPERSKDKQAPYDNTQALVRGEGRQHEN